MSQVHKVIILNKPLKIFDFTPFQLILLVAATVTALLVGTNIPKDWKVGNLPAGFLAGLLIFCAAIVGVKMSEVKPWIWWKNNLLYRLGMVPKVFIPRPEDPPHIYPDPSIIEAKKASDDYYVQSE